METDLFLLLGMGDNLPFSSDKQRKYMNWAAEHGKIKQSVVDEYNQASKGLKLPESAPKKKKSFKKLHSIMHKEK